MNDTTPSDLTEREADANALEAYRARIDDLTQELASVRDTLRRRTDSHAALIADRLACPNCSTLPIEETPA